ncbi:Hypothetical protein GLP15_1747 [Giardia lamblia P15]|uniref:Uncharacterized protein n=1 Tax=Giardia intestinalis (strain P15) TaxID=658858 RepID=E1F7A9_GIAIA|nr:Hypothetical protein GLP15_1747 [Giardia lamblia P15]
MLNSNIDSYLRLARHAPTLHCPFSIYSDLKHLKDSSNLPSSLLRLLSYSLSRFNLFRSAGSISFSDALAPAAPHEHYAYPCFTSLLQFLGYRSEDCNTFVELQTSPQNHNICTHIASLDELACALSLSNTQNTPLPDLESEATSDSEELSDDQQSLNRSRPRTHVELHLRHLRRSIPRLKSTKYANLYLLRASSRPAVCPNIILVEDSGGAGLATLFRSICYRVSDVHSNLPIHSIFSTVYSTSIGEKQRLTMAHRNLQMQCCNYGVTSDFTTERVLFTVQESKRIMRLFNRRERQKDGTWTKRPRKPLASPSESITQALLRLRAAAQADSKGSMSVVSDSECLLKTIPENKGENKETCQHSSSLSLSSSEASLITQHKHKIISYFSYLSRYPTLAWDPVTVIDFSPIQYDILTFDMCSEISFNLGTVHKEAGTKAAKRPILMSYNRHRFSYRRQLFRAQLFYHILSNSSSYKLESDKYYYNSLNDCMDLHVEQEVVEKRKSQFRSPSIHEVLCGITEEDGILDEVAQKISEPGDIIPFRKVTETKKTQKKNTKSNSKYSILDQMAKASQKPPEAIDCEISEPPRKQPSSFTILSTDSFSKLLNKILDNDTNSLQHIEKDAPVPIFINGRGQTQYKYSLINESLADNREDLSFISVPLCEIAPFNCSHLFMLKDVASDVVKCKALACEALVLACYDVTSWQISRHTLSLRPNIRQLSNLIHFWGDTANMPLMTKRKQNTTWSDHAYIDVIEACSSLCGGFLILSGSSYLSLYQASTGQASCAVEISHIMNSERIQSAVRYALLSQKGSRKRYRVDFVPETCPTLPVIEKYLSYLEHVDQDAIRYNILLNLDQKGIYGDILLANGEIMTRRMIDTIHMAFPMVDYGAPSSVLQGLDILEKMERAQFLKNDLICFSDLHRTRP